jgi:hypothetical protein
VVPEVHLRLSEMALHTYFEMESLEDWDFGRAYIAAADSDVAYADENVVRVD